MSVFILGMEFPSHCRRCPLRDKDDDSCTLLPESARTQTWEYQRKHCPLVEVKTPNGRLIDGDALYHKLHDAYHGAISDSQLYVYEVLGMIEDAETVIPAEGGGEDG